MEGLNSLFKVLYIKLCSYVKIGLRKRLVNLFLQFIETPEFNPEASRFQKVPRELLQQTQSIILE